MHAARSAAIKLYDVGLSVGLPTYAPHENESLEVLCEIYNKRS